MASTFQNRNNIFYTLLYLIHKAQYILIFNTIYKIMLIIFEVVL